MSVVYKIRYLTSARRDLQDVFSYIFEVNPSAARKVLDDIHRSVSQLSTFPYKGRQLEDQILFEEGYRILTVDKYLIFYIVLESKIEIRRIIHSRRLLRVLQDQD